MSLGRRGEHYKKRIVQEERKKKIKSPLRETEHPCEAGVGAGRDEGRKGKREKRQKNGRQRKVFQENTTEFNKIINHNSKPVAELRHQPDDPEREGEGARGDIVRAGGEEG